jgi:hypothetical protein
MLTKYIKNREYQTTLINDYGLPGVAYLIDGISLDKLSYNIYPNGDKTQKPIGKICNIEKTQDKLTINYIFNNVTLNVTSADFLNSTGFTSDVNINGVGVCKVANGGT